jgi:hypothetical protein
MDPKFEKRGVGHPASVEDVMAITLGGYGAE